MGGVRDPVRRGVHVDARCTRCEQHRPRDEPLRGWLRVVPRVRGRRGPARGDDRIDRIAVRPMATRGWGGTPTVAAARVRCRHRIHLLLAVRCPGPHLRHRMGGLLGVRLGRHPGGDRDRGSQVPPLRRRPRDPQNRGVRRAGRVHHRGLRRGRGGSRIALQRHASSHGSRA